MMETRTFELCPACAGQVAVGDELVAYHSDFSECARCGRIQGEAFAPVMGVEAETVSVLVETIHEEECDCGDIVRHNNGGNYHPTTYRVVG